MIMRLPTLPRIVSEVRVVVRIVLGAREAWRPVSRRADEPRPLPDIERNRLQPTDHEVPQMYLSIDAPPPA